MPSKNMLPKGKRRQSVRQQYREQRTLSQELDAAERALAEARGEAPVEEEEIFDEDELIDTNDMMHQELTLEERVARNDWITTKGATGAKVAEETLIPKRYDNPYANLEERARKLQINSIEVVEDLAPEDGVTSFLAAPTAAGLRLDAYLAKALPDISRARVQLLTDNDQVRVDGKVAKSKLKLKGGEQIEIEGEPQVAPLEAEPEAIPLTIVYEDADLAVIDKPAGMLVHAGAGSTEHNRGTLVNALLHHFGQLSEVGGTLRPGIVHRLDKQTSGLIVVAKNDSTHRKLAEMFAGRRMHKQYIALVHGWIDEDDGTVRLPISRDLQRRTRMTTKRSDGRTAVSHWHVLERFEGPYGRFTRVEVRIETGRTHQIRVHMQAIGHSVVGDFLYGAPHVIQPLQKAAKLPPLELERNFLHAAELEFEHPRTGQPLELAAPLPEDLEAFLASLR